jgi:hypothetical protein
LIERGSYFLDIVYDHRINIKASEIEHLEIEIDSVSQMYVKPVPYGVPPLLLRHGSRHKIRKALEVYK